MRAGLLGVQWGRTRRRASNALSWRSSSGTLPAWMTVTRLTPATRYNSGGVRELVGADVPRFDWNPAAAKGGCLLIEPTRTNLNTWSNQLDNATGGYTIQTTATLGSFGTNVDGTTSTWKFYAVTTNTTANRFITRMASFVAGTVYTLSAHAKPNEAGWVQMAGGAGAFTDGYANFDLITGVTGFSSSILSSVIAPAGASMYRCSLTKAATTTATANGLALYLMGNVNAGLRNPSVYMTANDGIQISDFQVEEGANATSYIPTPSSSQVTRMEDILTITPGYPTGNVTFTFDNGATQTLTGLTFPYVVNPASLNRPWIDGVDPVAA